MNEEKKNPSNREEITVSESAHSESYARKDDRRYTYSDYLKWDDDQRWELIDGVPYLMSAPSRWHQKIIGNLFGILYNLLKGKSCEAYVSPFDVRLNVDTYDNTVVQPDILVVCDTDKLNDAGLKGAPDFVVEVLSPSTSNKDRFLKFDKYRQAGVREYWIIETDAKKVSAHILSNDDYITCIYSETDLIPISVLDNCTIDLTEVFS